MALLTGCTEDAGPLAPASEEGGVEQVINDPDILTPEGELSGLGKAATLWGQRLHWDYYNEIRARQNGELRWFLGADCNDGLDAEDLIRQAFAHWQPYTKFRFVEANARNDANIVIVFDDGADVRFQDGTTRQWMTRPAPGRISVTFGLGFAPMDDRRGLGLDDCGDVYINDNVQWRQNGTSVQAYGLSWPRSLVEVLTHEIGHALGLAHDGSSTSNIMCAGGNRTNRTGELFDADVTSICHLYQAPALFHLGVEGTNRVIDAGYRRILGRAPDAGGMATYRDHLSWNILPSRTSRYTVQHFYAALIASDEFFRNVVGRNNGRYVVECYRRLLGREPDNGGYNYYVGNLGNGTFTRKQVALSMVHSDEWCRRYVTQLYHTHLGRAPDAGGLSDWATQIRRQSLLPSEVLIGICSSDEYMHERTGTTDTFIRRMYATILGRNPDQGGFTDWRAWLQ
jgi:hypothetical protein